MAHSFILTQTPRPSFALDLNANAGAVVQHEAAQITAPGQPVDERPEAYALDDALDDDTPPLNSCSGQSRD